MIVAEESEGQFTCLGENAKNDSSFSAPRETEVRRIDKGGKESTKNISYRLQFIDSAKFTESSLSNLVNNIAEGIHRIKCKYGHDEKKLKLVKLNTKIAFLNI